MKNPVQTLTSALKDIGLSEKEATVYLALLSLGRGTVAQIARKAKIQRTTGYDILDSLTTKGLASISGKKPRQEYIVEPPEKITTYLQSIIKENQQHLIDAQKIVPELKSFHRTSDRPQVRFYEGKQGLRDVYEDTLTAKEKIRACANVADMHKALPDYFPEYYIRRSKKHISIDAIIPSNEYGAERKQHDAQELRTTALIPENEYYFSPEINIYDNKVMIASWKEELGIIIESKEIADAMKTIFKLAWCEAQRLDAQIASSCSIQKTES